MEVDGHVNGINKHVVVWGHVQNDEGEARGHLTSDGDAEGGHYLAA